MPIRYAEVRKKLFAVKGIGSAQPPPDVAALNKLASEQGDKLTAVPVKRRCWWP